MNNFIGLGVAGNFHMHLEQVGEAENFRNITIKDPSTPKGLFPWYVASNIRSGNQNPLSYNILHIPSEIDIHPEPELAIYFDVKYESNGKIRSLHPKKFTAFNDASMCNIKRSIPKRKTGDKDQKVLHQLVIRSTNLMKTEF